MRNLQRYFLSNRCFKRKIFSSLQSIYFYQFSQTLKPTNDWLQKRQMHIKILQNRDHFNSTMTDENLIKLVDQHYCFNDIVSIASHIVDDKTYQNKQANDCEVIFIAYTHNLFHNLTQNIPHMLQLILKNLLNKISSQTYHFQSPQIQKHFLQQIFFLTHRNCHPLNLQKEIVTNYFKFINKKHGVDCITRDTINDQTLLKIWPVLPYTPKQSKGIKFLDHFQQLILSTLQYQSKRLAKQRKNKVLQRDLLNEGIQRFDKLFEMIIRLGKCRESRFINIFKHLPFKFDSQDDFADFTAILRQLMTSPLLKIIDFKELDAYHGKLSQSNKLFNKGRAFRNYESYCESMVCLDVYNPYAFEVYFRSQGQVFRPKTLKKFNQTD